MKKNTYELEKTKLSKIIEKVSDAREFLENSLDSLGKENLDRLKDLRENPETSGLDFFLFLEQLHQDNLTFNVKDKYKRLDELKHLQNEPYFARIDLRDKKNNETNPTEDNVREVYIGKFGYTEEEPVITDWRAKIASVYYRYRYPQSNVKYDTPEGLKIEDLLLKRTYEIESGDLLKYYNNDLQLDESEIIAEKIEKRTGGVLEDIIETIQESQLDIIESDPRKVCIVQGCVGSGKSTVAIHKLSHIFFNYPDLIHPERSILIAKNQILVSYLSTLFPKLGIFNINYKTMRELAFNVVFREKMNIKLDLDKNQNTAKVNLEFVRRVDREIKKVQEEYKKKVDELFKNEEYESFGGFNFSNEETTCENLNELLSELEEELVRQKESYEENPKSIRAIFYKDNMKNLRKIIKVIKKYRLDLKNKSFRNAVKTLGIDVDDKLGYQEALVYLYVYLEMIGLEEFRKYEYCVVDEGQDFSLLEYLFLQKLVLKGRFCILGDLNQSYNKSGIESWEDIKSVIKEAKDAQVFTLETNYRSTKPIIEFARNLLSRYTKKYLPNSINRVGENPVIEAFPSNSEMKNKILEEVKKETDKSVGIIAFDENSIKDLENLLNDSEIAKNRDIIKLDKNKNINYTSRGIYLMGFDNCKGLEFSKVYVVGLDIEKIDNFNSAKKAFIAASRAMNELYVYYVK